MTDPGGPGPGWAGRGRCGRGGARLDRSGLVTVTVAERPAPAALVISANGSQPGARDADVVLDRVGPLTAQACDLWAGRIEPGRAQPDPGLRSTRGLPEAGRPSGLVPGLTGLSSGPDRRRGPGRIRRSFQLSNDSGHSQGQSRRPVLSSPRCTGIPGPEAATAPGLCTARPEFRRQAARPGSPRPSRRLC